MRLGRIRDVALGLCYVALVLAIALVTWLFYNQAFTPRDDITLSTGTIGNALQEGSDVKLNGVPVGTVDDIEPTTGGAELTLAMQPEALDKLAVDTTARLLPKTLFGERYVALQTPDVDPAVALEPGGTIHQDSSTEAVELEQVFDELLPVLQAIEPQKLSATLGELVLALRGNGSDLGLAMAKWGTYLTKFNPLTPQMADDLGALGRVAQDYADAAPDLLQALDTMTTTTDTIAEQSTQLNELYANVIVAADDTNDWLVANSDTIKVLSSRSRKAMQSVAPYARQFPCLFKALNDYIPVMDKVLGKGTNEPGMHVVLNVTESRGKYVMGRDDPTFATSGKPRCPYQDGSVKAARQTAGGAAKQSTEPTRIQPPPSARIKAVLSSGAGLGEANSPAENQLISELMAPGAGVAPAQYPEWGSLLLGPILRDAEVEIR